MKNYLILLSFVLGFSFHGFCQDELSFNSETQEVKGKTYAELLHISFDHCIKHEKRHEYGKATLERVISYQDRVENFMFDHISKHIFVEWLSMMVNEFPWDSVEASTVWKIRGELQIAKAMVKKYLNASDVNYHMLDVCGLY